MDSDEILTTGVGISQLMNVRNIGARDGAGRTFATVVTTQTLLYVVSKDGLEHLSLLNANYSMRTIVIVNRRLLAWAPADHQHFDRLITTNSMTPVIAFLESDVRLEIEIVNLGV